ncbi:MAG: capsular exopolysaccharide family [Actinomycetia bacterium]|nr:capsular exopolysaccharide family [Actinomycetes bacterium]
MTDAAIRRYLDVVRREWWVVLQAAIVVGLVAGFVAHHDQSSSYQAHAQLYVEPAVGPDGTLPLAVQPTAGDAAPVLSTVLASTFQRQATAPEVLADAARKLGTGTGPLGATVKASVNLPARTVTIDTSAATPDQATKVANAVAQSVIDTRWTTREGALNAQIAGTNKQLQDIESQISQINAQEAISRLTNPDTTAFETSKTVWLSQYQAVFANQQQFQASLTSHDSGVKFLLPAQGAVKSSSTSPVTRGLQGALIGLLIGIGLAALREALDTKVRDREWVEDVAGLRTLGELPKDRNLRKRRLRVGDAPGSRYAESVRALRASLMWTVDRGSPASIAVTSPQSGDGKTTVATNLAAAYALSGLNTILVSADLRAPTVHRELFPGRRPTMGNTPDRGLAELLVDVDLDLSDPAVLSRALMQTRIEHLRWLPATIAASPSPLLSTRAAELLSSARAGALIQALTASADLVVIDTPLALLSEAASLTGLVDGVVLVVRPGSTRRAALRRTMRSWRGSPITPLGVVLNGTRPSRKDEVARGSETSAHYLRERKQELAWRKTQALPLGPPTTGNGNGNGNGNGSGNGHSSSKPGSSKPFGAS